ncbi:MAG: GDP-mannose mannosyl hydrolase [Verrucomicrobiota bacterium]|jgi:colanic acid biosynthesis protein WcaH
MNTEPQPGQKLEPKDFATVIRLAPLAAIDIIVRSPGGRVLLGRRSNEPAKGCFFVCGGRITKNETLEAAFSRISLAELGREQKIRDARLLGAFEHFYPANAFEQTGFGTHYVVLAYELTASLEITSLPAGQHGEYVWKTEAELLMCPKVHGNTKAYFLRPE